MRVATLAVLFPLAFAQWDASQVSWYSSAAIDFEGALPIGNGRLGAAVWGTGDEKVTLNENSIWDGGFEDRLNPDAGNALASVRSDLESGQMSSAQDKSMQDLASEPNHPRYYHPLANLTIQTGHDLSQASNYSRSLDLVQGNVVVEYSLNGVTYTREFIASYPASILAIRFSGNQDGSLDLTIALERTQYVITNSAQSSNGANSILLQSNTNGGDNPITFTSEVQVVNNGGQVSIDGSTVVVQGANTVDLFIDARSSYRYSSTDDQQSTVESTLSAAVGSGFESVSAGAIADHKQLASRVQLNLGSSNSDASNTPTDQRLTNYQSNPDDDVQLVTLMYNFGRHLLISSARGNISSQGLPPNLQGLWSESFSPPWGSAYTININLEMNYWPAEVTNLPETIGPLVDLLNEAVPHGQDVAKNMYGCDNGGFLLHHNTDLWGDAAPVDNDTASTIWPMGAAWLSISLMEHYRFTQDQDFLKNDAWPLIQKLVDFYSCYLFEWNGYLSTGPSLSPENSFVVPSNESNAGQSSAIDIGTTIDNSLLYELFQNAVEIGTILSLQDPSIDTANQSLSKIKPPQIGSYGQILEWRQEYNETEPGHRHFSPLFALFPGTQLTPAASQELSAAAQVLLDRRLDNGSGSTGWSCTWAMSLYARLFSGDNVWKWARHFLQTYPSSNLWNSDSGPGTPFQIDGNFGFTTGISEMLLQSHDSVHLLPSLPSAVPTGSVSGLVARGNFEISISWENGSLTQAQILSRSGGTLNLEVADGQSFTVNGAAYSDPIQTNIGSNYTISLSI